MKVPNGLTRARDGLVYVSEIITGIIHVFSQNEDRLLEKVDEITVGLPVDNLSIDSEGNVWGAALPQVYTWFKSAKDPSIIPPTTAIKISRKSDKGYGEFSRRNQNHYDGEYVVEKVLEDGSGALPGSTAVVHDPQTGRIYLSGLMSKVIAVCETR